MKKYRYKDFVAFIADYKSTFEKVASVEFLNQDIYRFKLSDYEDLILFAFGNDYSLVYILYPGGYVSFRSLKQYYRFLKKYFGMDLFCRL